MMLMLILIAMVIVFRLNINKKRKGSTGNNGTEAVKLVVPLKYLSNFGELLKLC